MKKIFILATLLFSVLTVSAQKKSKEVFLMGKIETSDLQTGTFNDWYQPNYQNYTPDAKVVEQIKSKINQYTITIFMGTWCEDSQHSIPAFFKILDQVGMDKSKVTLIAVDRDKKTKEGFENKINIFKVPTILVFRDGEEVNRIIETPVETLEKDLLKLVTGQHYVPNNTY